MFIFLQWRFVDLRQFGEAGLRDLRVRVTIIDMLDSPIVVPLDSCNCEPRGLVPYTGGRWYGNCAPQIYPIDEIRHRGGQSNSGAR